MSQSDATSVDPSPDVSSDASSGPRSDAGSDPGGWDDWTHVDDSTTTPGEDEARAGSGAVDTSILEAEISELHDLVAGPHDPQQVGGQEGASSDGGPDGHPDGGLDGHPDGGPDGHPEPDQQADTSAGAEPFSQEYGDQALESELQQETTNTYDAMYAANDQQAEETAVEESPSSFQD
jgi:hypothetical protein